MEESMFPSLSQKDSGMERTVTSVAYRDLEITSGAIQ